MCMTPQLIDQIYTANPMKNPSDACIFQVGHLGQGELFGWDTWDRDHLLVGQVGQISGTHGTEGAFWVGHVGQQPCNPLKTNNNLNIPNGTGWDTP